jgi:molybdenum cofactor biosynthesis enzyme
MTRMVDIGNKEITMRTARARGKIRKKEMCLAQPRPQEFWL